ncbi:hypothetical protein TSOC_011675, partial [Tetrabaena socialis]
LAALEAFYDLTFGQPTNSLDYRRAVFAAYIGDTDNWVDLKHWALGEAKRMEFMPAHIPVPQSVAAARNISARQANDRAAIHDAGHDDVLQPLVTLGSGFITAGTFPGPEVPFPLTRQELHDLTAEQLDALEAFYGTRFGKPTSSLRYRRAEFAASVGDTRRWGDLKQAAVAEAGAARIDVAREPHRL